jgi:hypothetical protein
MPGRIDSALGFKDVRPPDLLLQHRTSPSRVSIVVQLGRVQHRRFPVDNLISPQVPLVHDSEPRPLVEECRMTEVQFGISRSENLSFDTVTHQRSNQAG